jgi:hypothetical protein
MDQGNHTRQILSFDVSTEQGRILALANLKRLASLAEAGLIEGLAVRSVQTNGQVRYQSFGSVTAEDWTRFVLYCVSAR